MYKPFIWFLEEQLLKMTYITYYRHMIYSLILHKQEQVIYKYMICEVESKINHMRRIEGGIPMLNVHEYEYL